MKLSLHRIAVPLLVLSAALGTVVLPASQAGGGATNRAGVVVRQSDGTVRDMCVFFDEAEITGYELLERSGFDFEAEVYYDKPAICKIGPDGCSPSRGEDCLKCKAPNAWSYWVRDKGEATWEYSQLGAGSRKVRGGALDGWTWGEGSKAPTPPNVSFSDVCPASATSTSAPRPAPVSGGSNGGGSYVPPSDGGSDNADRSDGRTGRTETERLEIENGTAPVPSGEASPGATGGERNEAQASKDEDDTEPASYLMFGGFALVFALIAAGLYFMRRRRAQSDT